MIEALDQVGLFGRLSEEAREALAARGRLRVFGAGEVLMREGEASDAMHVIMSGRVLVTRMTDGPDGILPLGEIGANSVVGEIGVLDGGPRTATVTAVVETRTVELHRTVLAVVLMQYPTVAGELLRILSSRLRSADELAEQLSREGLART